MDEKRKPALDELFQASVPIEGMLFPGDRLIDDDESDDESGDGASDVLPTGWRTDIRELGEKVLESLPPNHSDITEAIAVAAEKLGVSSEDARQAYESFVYGR